jgi:hypothetical protein
VLGVERTVLREGSDEVEVTQQVTGTGPRLRIRSLVEDAAVELDPLELEGLTRLPFTAFPALEDRLDEADAGLAFGPPEPDLRILRNEFAMVGVSVADDPEGPRLRVRNMASGAEVRLKPGHLARLTRLRHRDLAPLVDPSGLAAEEEPDPDQV